MQNFRALGAKPPHPRASGGWGLFPQTPSLRRLGASPPNPQTQPPHCEFLATRLPEMLCIRKNTVNAMQIAKTVLILLIGINSFSCDIV